MIGSHLTLHALARFSADITNKGSPRRLRTLMFPCTFAIKRKSSYAPRGIKKKTKNKKNLSSVGCNPGRCSKQRDPRAFGSSLLVIARQSCIRRKSERCGKKGNGSEEDLILCERDPPGPPVNHSTWLGFLRFGGLSGAFTLRVCCKWQPWENCKCCHCSNWTVFSDNLHYQRFKDANVCRILLFFLAPTYQTMCAKTHRTGKKAHGDTSLLAGS